MVTSQQPTRVWTVNQKAARADIQLSRTVANDIDSLTRSYLLEFPQPSKMVPPARERTIRNNQNVTL